MAAPKQNGSLGAYEIVGVRMTARMPSLFLNIARVFSFPGARSRTALQPVPSVDLARYVGKWYEIAHIPNRFERKCAGNATARYTLRSDGKIGVVRQWQRSNGQVEMAKGTAEVENLKEHNTKLKVTFFWPFSGDYWILDLSPDYQWALVGEPRRRYLWVLSRQPQMDEGIYQRILNRAKQKGYDVTSIRKTAQNLSASKA